MQLPEFVTKELTKSLGVDMDGYDLVEVKNKLNEGKCSSYEVSQTDQGFPIFYKRTTQNISESITINCLRSRALFVKDDKFIISEMAECKIENSLSEGAKTYFNYNEYLEDIPVKNGFGNGDKNWAMIRSMLSTVKVCDTE